MEYAFESFFWNYNSGIFIYDNQRICSKLYVVFKIIGLVFYAASLPTCDDNKYYIGMIVAMFLSLINSIRYEYAHFKRYGTIFSSINEYEEWKNRLYPKLKILFSMIELLIKIFYFTRIFPPVYMFHNLCEISESIFKIHVIFILIMYIVVVFFSILIFCSDSDNNRLFISQSISSPNLTSVINNQNDECCICLDIGETNSWSMLACGHKFHKDCVLPWIQANHTCPICRIHIS